MSDEEIACGAVCKDAMSYLFPSLKSLCERTCIYGRAATDATGRAVGDALAFAQQSMQPCEFTQKKFMDGLRQNQLDFSLCAGNLEKLKDCRQKNNL